MTRGWTETRTVTLPRRTVAGAPGEAVPRSDRGLV